MTTPIKKTNDLNRTNLDDQPYSDNPKNLPRKQNNTKKKIKYNDIEPRVLPSSKENFKNADGNSLDSYSSIENKTTLSQTRNQNNLDQLYSPNSSAVSPPLQLKSLDHHNFQRDFRSPVALPMYHKNSVDGSSNRPTATLPPIGATLLMDEQTQDGLGLHAPFMPSERPSKLTSVPLSSYHNNSYPNLPTLDSFEASIMKTLPFDNNPDFTRYCQVHPLQKIYLMIQTKTTINI